MRTAAFDRDLLKNIKRHTVGIVGVAAVFLFLAPFTLLGSILWTSGRVLLIGQIFSAVFVIAAIILLVVTGISQDIRGK